MPRYEITAPDGGRYEITAPDGASESEVLSYAQSQFSGKSEKPAVTAPDSGVAMGMRDAIDGGAQLLRRAVPDAVGNAMDSLGSWLASKGLPVAPTQGVEGVDALVKGVNEGYEEKRNSTTPPSVVTGQKEAPGFDWARLGGNLLNPLNYVGGGVKGAVTMGKLAKAGAVGGAVGGAMQPVVNQQENFWTTKAQQAGSGAAFGAALGPAAAKAGELGAKGVNAVVNKGKGITVSADRIDVATANALRSGGIDYASLPQQVLESVKADVAQALQAGAKLDPKAIVRKAEFEMVGLSGDSGPTLGQLTRDPMQFAMEKNLSGIRMDDGSNPLATRFQNQSDALGGVFDDLGALSAREPVLAGQDLQRALVQSDEPVKASVGRAYEDARSMNDGRSVELDRPAFSQSANDALNKGMWGHFLPPNVRSLLNGVSDGSVPFTVESAEQIDSILAKSQRTAGSGSAEASAIGVIRQALRDTQFATRLDDLGATTTNAPLLDGGGVEGAGQATRDAFSQAREMARNRFKTIENTPALASALDGDLPDSFVKKYIIGGKLSDMQNLKLVLADDEKALSQVRAQISEHLKSAAFGTNAAGDKAFAPDRYARALEAIGNEKLKVFFTPQEVGKLNVAAKVAANINSRPAGSMQAVNGSGTGAALFNLLTKLPVVGQPIKAATTARANTIAIDEALKPSVAGANNLTPEQIETVRKLFSKPAGVTGGVIGGSGF